LFNAWRDNFTYNTNIVTADVGADIMLISARSNSTIGDLADAVFQIGTPEMYDKVKGMPMGTVFELSTLLFLESTISHIIHEKDGVRKFSTRRHILLLSYFISY
jgi:D-arabinose 5-phosphate isomerase GutQ